MSRDQKFELNEIGELALNLVCLDKQIGISERGLTYLTFYIWNELTRSFKLRFQIIQDQIWAF